ncbi:Hypothetical protein PBC10988_32890 [Planctomycetales bacterium 10988]|nr:Hypothetical protein PBC10988_32890 [Planctomycetales bacterium 10988]
MRELLIGYLLEILEPEEYAYVEEQLQREPSWREALEQIRSELDCLQADPAPLDPPQGLAERTCDQLFSGDSTSFSELNPVSKSNRWRNWSLCDVVATLAMTFSFLLLLGPCLCHLQSESQLSACKDHLREIGKGFSSYSLANAGFYPPLLWEGPLSGPSSRTLTLFEEGHLTDPTVLQCPSATEASLCLDTCPSRDSFLEADEESLKILKRSLGGSYAFSLGYEQEQDEQNPMLSRSQFALVADRPSALEPQLQSRNHGGKGQNVLFEDGHVQFLSDPVLPASAMDHIFLNRIGLQAPGLDEQDSVMAPCDGQFCYPPAIHTISKSQ